MKSCIPLLLLLVFFAGCGKLAKVQDESLHYKSIVGKIGTIKVNLGGEVVSYENYTVESSDSDATTILIKSPEGKYIYIQGFAVIEFNDFGED